MVQLNQIIRIIQFAVFTWNGLDDRNRVGNPLLTWRFSPILGGMALEALGEIVRSRILFVVACGLIFGTAWFGLSDALAQTPLRPATPAASQEVPLRPDSVPTASEENIESLLSDGPPQATQQVSPKPQASQLTAPPSATAGAKKTEKSAEAVKLAGDAAAMAKPAMQDKKPAAGGDDGAAAVKAGARLGSAQLLPGHTKAWVSIPNMVQLTDSFKKAQFGVLAQGDAIKPFVESLKDQFRDWAAEKNVRLGVKIENIDEFYSGEICLAGVVPVVAGQGIKRGSHGLVLLVDVSGRQDKAAKFLAEVNRRLVEKGAVQDTIEINGASVTRSIIEKKKRLRAGQTSLQTIFDGWLLAADNEKIFRDVMFRLATTKPGKLKPDTLAAQPAFKAVAERTSLAPHAAQYKWFVDPFGYIQLAQALADDEKDTREHRDDWAKILKAQGFDVLKGAGGQGGFMLGEHELLHRTFVYAPQKNLTKPEQKRVFGLFDFLNKSNEVVTPTDWVPSDLSAFFVGKWNFSNALENVGFLYDAFLNDPGAFERVLQDFKNDPDMQLNIRKLIGQLDNEWTILSATAKPIDGNSERVAIAFKMKADADGDFVLDSIRRAVGNGRATKIKLGGKTVIEVSSEATDAGDEIPEDLDIFDDPLEGEDLDDEEPEEEAFSLFDKKYFAVEHGHLLVANHKDYMKKILANKQKKKLVEMSDYQRVDAALLKLVENKIFSARQFGRLDKALEANYQLLRTGKMEQSTTVLGKVINQILKPKDSDAADAKKEQVKRLDGKDLPADYAKAIAPYLGIMGWAIEVEEEGWRISGCILKRAK